MRRAELRLPLALVLACALVAGGTSLSRAARAQHDKAAFYARIIAACATGRYGFRIADTYVECGTTALAGK